MTADMFVWRVFLLVVARPCRIRTLLNPTEEDLKNPVVTARKEQFRLQGRLQYTARTANKTRAYALQQPSTREVALSARKSAERRTKTRGNLV